MRLIPASKVRIQLLGKNYLSFAELQVHDSSGNNVALNKIARQSSDYKAKPSASNAVNGNLDSMSHTNDEQEAWWEVDLQSDYQIQEILIYARKPWRPGLEKDWRHTWDRVSNSKISLIRNGIETGVYEIGDASLLSNGARYISIAASDFQIPTSVSNCQKYKTENGIRKYNPAYHEPSATAVAVPFVNQTTALPIVAAVATAPSLEEDIAVGAIGGDEEISFVPTSNYGDAVTKYHEEIEPEIYLGGYSANNEADGGDSLDELNAILAKYEVPAGMLSKLLDVRQFDVAEIIVDDSGSMGLMTDAKDPKTGASMSRWWEAKHRISQMVELLAYVVCPPITVRFLNRHDELTLRRDAGELPKTYIERAEAILVKTFQRGPAGGTPALEAIQASLNRYGGKKVLRYFMGDGMPNGGTVACRKIADIITRRPLPKENPFTFMSCTNDDDQVEWMKTTEEIAPFCSEFDDYHDESREVLKDQGVAFPYSFGLHLVSQIVAAFNPLDLDAMDESIPFTKTTLDNLLGYQSSLEEYRYYFDGFCKAQTKLKLTPPQRSFVGKLPELYQQFVATAVATDIPAAAQYKNQMKMANSRQAQNSPGTSRGATVTTGDDCCVIL